MADSAIPRTADPASHARVIAVAYSGGRDSTALLHAAAHAASALSLEGQGVRVFALHVHHGLSRHADEWLQHCQRQCEDWAAQGLPLSFSHRRLDGGPDAGESIEAWARAGRYAALAEMAEAAGASLLLLAHHRRDQAETWLLQALRGAGVAGLAAMPAVQLRDGLVWARPWLAQPRSAIEDYVREHGLSHIEDDSNIDTRFARNRLRLQVWPALEHAFTGAEQSLAQAAAWSQQAMSLALEVADEDLRRWQRDETLDVMALSELSTVRASNLLRAWLQAQLGVPAPGSLVQRLMRELPGQACGRWPAPGGWLRLYRGHLKLERGAQRSDWPAPRQIDLSDPGLHACEDWGGAWRVETVSLGGVHAQLLRQLTMRARSGGEQFQQQAGGVPRRLKKAWQSAGVDESGRQGPLLFAGERLLYLPGLGLDARCLAQAGQAQLSVEWLPD